LVFYQSHHLRQCGAQLLGASKESTDNRHIVLPRGIPAPPGILLLETRRRVRKELQIRDDQTLVLYVGRIIEGTGIFDLLEATRIAISRNPQIRCVLVGSVPEFDHTSAVQEKLKRDPVLNRHMQLLPSCDPEKVWEFLSAGDIFAFPSLGEGMPNALLEAMVMGVASVAYAIPPAVELDANSGSVVRVPTGNTEKFAEAIVQLADSPGQRSGLAERAKARVAEKFMVNKNMLEALRRLEALV